MAARAWAGVRLDLGFDWFDFSGQWTRSARFNLNLVLWNKTSQRCLGENSWYQGCVGVWIRWPRVKFRSGGTETVWLFTAISPGSEVPHTCERHHWKAHIHILFPRNWSQVCMNFQRFFWQTTLPRPIPALIVYGFFSCLYWTQFLYLQHPKSIEINHIHFADIFILHLPFKLSRDFCPSISLWEQGNFSRGKNWKTLFVVVTDSYLTTPLICEIELNWFSYEQIFFLNNTNQVLPK